MGDFAIETADLVKVYRSRFGTREVRALDGVSIRVKRGGTFGLLGPNGAGKTTVVKLLLGIAHPTAGSAHLFGVHTGLPSARLPVGYLPENHRFPTYMTGAGMLDLYGALSGMPAGDRARRIPELLARVGIEKWADVRLGKFSKGMLQRVGLAQAMMHSPELLILDEPTDGVDPVGRVEVRGILQQLESRGVTIFINSHQLSEIELFCHDVAILNRGRVALAGSVRELTADSGFRLTGRRASGEAVSLAFREVAEANRAMDELRAGGGLIETFGPSRSTLEDVFVRTVQETPPQ